MMNNFVTWLKENKVLAVVILSILVYMFFFSNSTFRRSPSTLTNQYMMESDYYGAAPAMGGFGGVSNKMISQPYYSETPQMDASNRMVVTNSNLSLAVKDVLKSINEIKKMTKDLGGYMVSSSQSAPEGPASGDITIRVPAEKLDETLEFLRSSAVKVVSENINGTDVTDEYIDIDTRMKTLEGTKARYEGILASATTVDEILQVTNNILSIQDQIDYLKGRAEYLKNTSSSVLVTVYLSTDEYSLPYAPEKPWRPEVVFKNAVRSLIIDLRGLGSKAIELAVYSVIWVPVLVVSIFTIRKLRKNNNQ